MAGVSRTRTENGLTVTFDDDEEMVTIEVPYALVDEEPEPFLRVFRHENGSQMCVTYAGLVSDDTFERYRLQILEGM